jgi:Protein of unknown function (DUF2855)
MLYRPLYWTSFWCEDWLLTSNYRGADHVLISSASSKTAFCLAYCIRKRIAKGEISPKKIVALTSSSNMAFTKSLQLYDKVFSYDSFDTDPYFMLTDDKKWIYVDVSGNDMLNERIYSHFQSNRHLAAGIALGMTTMSPSASEASSGSKWSLNTFTNAPSPLKGPASMEQFFMVEWLNVRRRQLPPAQIFRMQDVAWKELIKDCVNWVKIETVSGCREVKQAYERLAKKGLDPNTGFIWSLWDDVGSTVQSKL